MKRYHIVHEQPQKITQNVMKYTFRLDFNDKNCLASKKYDMELGDFEDVEKQATANMLRKDAVLVTVRDEAGKVVFRVGKFCTRND